LCKLFFAAAIILVVSGCGRNVTIWETEAYEENRLREEAVYILSPYEEEFPEPTKEEPTGEELPEGELPEEEPPEEEPPEILNNHIEIPETEAPETEAPEADVYVAEPYEPEFPEIVTPEPSDAALAALALANIRGIFDIPPGEEGAFDVDVSFSAPDISLSMNMKQQTDGHTSETLVTAEIDMGDIVGILGGVNVNFGIHTLSEGGEIVDLRFSAAGIEFPAEMLETLGLTNVTAAIGADAERLLGEMFGKMPEISEYLLETFEITINYSNGGRLYSIGGTQIALDFVRFLLGPLATELNLGGMEFGDFQILMHFEQTGQPESFYISAAWSEATEINHLTANIVINAVGDAVNI